MLSVVKLFFHDKRLTVVVLVTWMCTACGIFYHLGAFHSQFMTFGPSPKTEFMAMKIDTWDKWYALATFSFLNTTINEFIASALVPWFTNTIQDQKTKYLDHSKTTCIMISLIFDVYTHVMGVFGIYLMFSQIDFLFVRMVADCLVTCFTTIEWMRFKRVDKIKHDLEGGLTAAEMQDHESTTTYIQKNDPELKQSENTPGIESGSFIHRVATALGKCKYSSLCPSSS